VDPVADSLLLRKSGSAGNPTQASGSVARNSPPDHGDPASRELYNLNIPDIADYCPYNIHIMNRLTKLI
jgi:hypothetical protein